MAGVAGFEPTFTVLETVALPLNYTPMVEGVGLEPTNPMGADLQSAAFGQLRYPSNESGSGRNRTADTRIFSPLLYRLSYRAIM